MKKTISAVIITMNEEENIRACLEGIKWTDEIVIVDSFSSDRTLEICRGYTNKIFQREMSGFGEQKQFAIEKAASDWILSIDADEVVTKELKGEIKGVLKEETEYNGFKIFRKNIYLGRPIRYCGWYVPIIRLFKRGKGRFNEKKVHEEIFVDGNVGLLKGEIMHNTYKNISHHLEKIDSFTTYDADELIKKGVVLKPSNCLWYFVFKPMVRFFQKFVLQKGIFEGIHGLILSINAAMVVFINYVKLWEKQQKNKKDY
ncbi:MAG: glycosyltransferase family 2 protein [Nitrospinae bacterium]|nr:glycosyltransferase family 2 protein [Nitrospinota bacterium]